MNQPSTTITNPPGNAFSRLLSEFREGQSLAELSDLFRQLVAAVQQTNRAGTLTYTIKLAPSSSAIIVTDEIKLKSPTEERDKAIFFPTEDHTLQRTNPAQKEFNLKELAKPAPEIREVASTAAV